MSTDTFWTWLAGEATAIRAGFAEAAAAKDYPALEHLANRIAAEIHKIDPRIVIRLNGSTDGNLALAVTSPDPAALPTALALLAAAPKLEGWTFGEVIESPAKNIIVRAHGGEELVVAYRDIRFRLLPPKPEGTVSVIFTVPTEFDPKSTRGQLYQAAATEILKYTFGGTPPGMGSYAFVPASWVEQPTRPVAELARAWEDRARSPGSGEAPG